MGVRAPETMTEPGMDVLLEVVGKSACTTSGEDLDDRRSPRTYPCRCPHPRAWHASKVQDRSRESVQSELFLAPLRLADEVTPE
ncbi:hypothetical protein GCM10023201_26200 [Actinomycetospora corticicola]